MSNVHIATSAPTIPLDTYTQLESRFSTLLGPDSVSRLAALPPARHPVIILAGSQCTGKSTLAHRLATLLHGKSFAAGQLFRRRAKELGITNAELSRRALADPAIDVGIEYSLCELICTGDPDGPLIIEGRQPAVMENYIRTKIGKRATVRIRLNCTFEEQASRFIEREYGRSVACDVMAKVASDVDVPRPASRLSDLTPALRRLHRPELEKLIRAFDDNDSRDEDDRKRFEALYGESRMLDHRTNELYDVIIDTTHNQAEDTFQQALFSLSRFFDLSAYTQLQAKL